MKKAPRRFRPDLREEFDRLLADTGYQPVVFPVSVTELSGESGTHLPSGAPFSQLQQDLLKHISTFTEEQRTQLEAGLDTTGYLDFVDMAAASGLLSDRTLDRVYCAEFPTGDFNASARRAQNGFLCLFNQGLRRMLFSVSLAAIYAVPETVGSSVQERVLHSLAAVFYVVLEYLCRRPPLLPQVEGVHYGQQTLHVGTGLSRSIRFFAVAHELAHVELGHLENADTFFSELALGNPAFLKKSREQEFQADELGQEILISSARSMEGNNMGFACGGLCFCAVDRMIDLVHRKVYGASQNKPATHPDSKERATALHKILRRELKPREYAGTAALEKVFLDTLKRAETVGLVFNDKGFELNYKFDPECT